MRDAAELVALANENFVDSFRTLAEHCEGGSHRSSGGAFAFVTGLPVSLFNGCAVVGPVSEAGLGEALDWLAEHDVPKRVFVVAELEAGVADVLTSRGFERDDVSYPALVLHPVPDAPVAAAGVEVLRVDEDNPEAFRAVGVALGMEPELARRMFPEPLLADPRVQAFVARLDGRPVGYSLAIASERANGVYNVGTLPDARRRGVGAALTWAAVSAGRHGGFDCAVLQSTPMARRLYEAMGFRKVLDYAVFRPTPSGQETPVPPSPQ
jgi:ribosomal protein S18 acetylase RimI-like enzyme